MSRRPLSAVGAALVALSVVLLPASQVFAHASLQSSDPAANSVLETSPSEVTLDFDEEVEAALSSVRVYGSDGSQVEVGAVTPGVDDSIIGVTVPTLTDGLYAVVWQVVSGDGHVVDGAFSFQVGAVVPGDGDALIDRVRASSSGSEALDTWYGIARFVSLVGVAMCIGVFGWMVVGLGALVPARRASQLRWTSVGLFTAGSIATFVLFWERTDGASFGDVVTTSTGRMLGIRVLFAAPVVGLAALWSRRASTVWRSAGALVALAVTVSCSASGHPNQLDPLAFWVGVDMVHVLAMSVWLGGLAVLVLADGALLREPEAVRPVRRFSNTATVAVAVVVGTGVAQGLRLAGSLGDVTATDWGRLLAVKVALVLAVVAVAGVSRWLLQHEGPASLRRTVVLEAVAAVVVLALAATMVGFAPRAGEPSRPFDEQLVSGGLIASVSISPGRVGANEVHILVTPPGGSLAAIESASARVSLPSAAIPASPVTLVDEGPNHFSGTVTFPRTGDWIFDLVLTTGANSTLVSATVTIP